MNKIKRIMIAAIGLIAAGFSISCFYTCQLGSDPISVFVDGQHVLFGLSYGEVTTINNIILAVLMFCLMRKVFGITTIGGILLTGPLIDLFCGLLGTWIPADSMPFVVKLIFAILGASGMGLAVALYIIADLGVGPFDFPSLYLAEHTKLDLKWARMIFDAIWLVAGFLMGGIVGIGTVIGMIMTGPMISMYLKHLKKPLTGFVEGAKSTEQK